MFDFLRRNVLGVVAALVAGIANPVSAAVIDFTANNNTTGNVAGTTWEVTAGRGASTGTLTNARHWNNAGCTGSGWNFACAATGNRFDVGFGVRGANNNEIDGNILRSEYVEVTFGTRVQVTGFAGMLSYANSVLNGAREQVVLEYLRSNGTWASVVADPLFIVNEPGGLNGNFDTVGLAFLDGLSIYTDRVRFKADGVGTADDGSFNVTAAGLQVATVPLPAAGFLLIGALGGLALLRRRKAAA